jgi:hypothetical protein
VSTVSINFAGLLVAALLICIGCDSKTESDIGAGSQLTNRIDVFGTNGPDINLSGTEADEWIHGLDGADILTGGPGNDVLEGGKGTDALVDREGNEIYIYNRGEGVDVISDENGEEDELRFGPGITANQVTFREVGGLLIAVDGDDSMDSNGYNLMISSWGQRGQYIENFRFSDGRVLSIDEVRVRVQGNRAPILQYAIPNQVVSVGESLEINLEAVFLDPERGNLRYRARSSGLFGPPPWLTLDQSTLRLFGTPSVTDVGTFEVLLTATDSSDATTDTVFMVEVQAP